MKKSLLAVAVLVFSCAIAPIALAEDEHVHDHNEEAHVARTMHYEGKSFNSADEALKGLRTYNAEIKALLAVQAPSESDLEKIHEISYSLETAIDKMIAEKAGSPNKLGAVDEAVQAIHYASEAHNLVETREWFAKLETSIQALDGKKVATEPNAEGAYEIVIKDHTFTPDELHVPAGEKLKLIVHNQDPTPEEFESDDFRREKIIPGNSSATIYVGPLKPGKYHFFGEFNLDKANGYLYAE